MARIKKPDLLILSLRCHSSIVASVEQLSLLGGCDLLGQSIRHVPYLDASIAATPERRYRCNFLTSTCSAEDLGALG